eukprot:1573121-Alexandrium_andersonii.AAC.1
MPDRFLDKTLGAGAGLRDPADNEGGGGHGRLRAFPGLQPLPVTLPDWCTANRTATGRAAVRPMTGKASIVDVVTTIKLRPTAILVSAKADLATIAT